MEGIVGTTEYRVVAYNTATASANKIHDDELARRYGFAGGLVPGVDVYAYMTHLPATWWGRDWLAHGTLQARFLAPVYDGDEVVVTAEGTSLSLRNGTGELCATGEAGLGSAPSASSASLPADDWPDAVPADEPAPASPESLAVGTALALPPHRADGMAQYLDDVRETLPLYAEGGWVHPGWLLRDANYVLSRNVKLGPWIHVESQVEHLAAVAQGAEVETRATVTGEWERKGHRFVTLAVVQRADGRPATRITHTAIYRPRPPDGA